MVIILVILNYSIQGNPELELSVGYIYKQPDKRSSLFQQATILEIHPQQLIRATSGLNEVKRLCICNEPSLENDRER